MDVRRESVYVVADESATAQELSQLLRANHKVRVFTSIRDFLDFDRDDSCACIIASLRNPRTTQDPTELISGTSLPVIFVTGSTDISAAVSAMKAGATDVLTKPINAPSLLASVERALQLDCTNRRQATERARLIDRYESLTPREREVLPLLTNGLLNKQAAFELGITEYTVQIHRGHIMRKMEADSFATLVKIATKLNLEPEPAEETNRNA